jgi:hypothetical protein
MFGAFIISCDTTHGMEVWTIWNGTYRLAGMIKLITAGLSISTALALVPIMLKALALPSPAKLADAIRALEQEMSSRKARRREIPWVAGIGAGCHGDRERRGQDHLINSQTEKLFGFDRTELLGLPADTLIPERFRQQPAPDPSQCVRD